MNIFWLEVTAILFLYFVLTAAVAFGAGYFVRKSLAEAKIASAEEAARRIIQDAERDAEAKNRELMLEAKEEAHKLRTELDREHRERRNELQQLERRLMQKEEALDRRSENVDRKEILLEKEKKELAKTQFLCIRVHGAR